MTSRVEILRLCHRYLCEHCGDDPGAFDITIHVHDDIIRFKARAGEFRGPPVADLSRPQRKILGVMPDGASWSVKKIAEESGYEEGPHLRTALAGLVKSGLLANDNEGYRLV